MTESNTWLIAWLAAIVAVIAAVAVRGCLRAGVFDQAPPRRVDLTPLDVLRGALIMLAGMLLLALLQSMIGTQGTPVSPPITLAWTILFQAVTQMPVVLFLLWRARGGGWGELGLWPRQPRREMGAAVLAFPAALVLAFGLSAIAVKMGQWLGVPRPEAGHVLLEVLHEAIETKQAWVVVILVGSAVVAAPLLEEIIFRGLVQTALHSIDPRKQRWLVVIIAATLFTLFHAGVPWQVLPSLFALGIILGWLYERYGSLLPCVMVHASFNASNTALTVLIEAGG